jgi:hypothetical protein
MTTSESSLKSIEDQRSLPPLWDVQSTEYKYRIKEGHAYVTRANKHCVDMVEVEKIITGVET